MATEVIIPAMGESISSGILAAWHVKDGDYVEKEQALYELETDKITSEANAEVAGIITLKVEVDDEVDIGQVVATIDETAAAPAGGSAAPAEPAAAATPAAPAEAAPAPAVTGTQHPLSPPHVRRPKKQASIPPRLPGPAKTGVSRSLTFLARQPLLRQPPQLRHQSQPRPQHRLQSTLRHVKLARR